MSFQKYIFTQKMFVLQIIYKSFLNIYSFRPAKKNFDHKKYICENFFVNSIIWSLKEAANLWCSLASSSQNINELLEKNLLGYLFLETLRAKDLTPPELFFKYFVQVFR